MIKLIKKEDGSFHAVLPDNVSSCELTSKKTMEFISNNNTSIVDNKQIPEFVDGTTDEEIPIISLSRLTFDQVKTIINHVKENLNKK